MRNVAIITYWYGEKSNSMSGLRPESWAKALAKAGISVTVFTRDWNESSIPKAEEHMHSTDYTGQVTNESNNISIVYLPYKKPWEPSNLFLRKVHSNFLAITGRYSAEADITQWHDVISEAHKKEPFTHILTTCYPFSSLRLLNRLRKTCGDCITLCDFRDYVNINLLNPGISFKLHSKMVIALQLKWITHYVKKINFITTASESISEKFEKVHGCRQVTTIYNGFEEDLFSNIEKQHPDDVFNVSLTGTLYHYQDIDFMLEGLIGFLNNYSTRNNIMINFIGVDYFPQIATKISDKLKGFESSFKITTRVKRTAGISLMKNSAVLFYVGWKGWKGIYSGKIFEYLGAKRNILIAPNDGDVLEKLIQYTQSGKLANTPAEMTTILSEWYQQWLAGTLEYKGIDKRINEFTREEQAKKVLQLITSAT
jgi:hypothetical protein